MNKYCAKKQQDCVYFGKCSSCSFDEYCKTRRGSHKNCFTCLLTDLDALYCEEGNIAMIAVLNEEG